MIGIGSADPDAAKARLRQTTQVVINIIKAVAPPLHFQNVA